MEEINDNKVKYEKSILIDKEIELIQNAKLGNEKALAMLIELNQGYIISFIRKQYWNLIKNDEFIFEDLVQEGNIGIMTAIYKFDETKGVKFITYASYWIKLSIMDAVKKYVNPYDETFAENDIQLNKDEGTSFEDYDSFANEDVLTENDAFNNSTKDDSTTEFHSDEIDNLLLSILDERETKILKMYFGINNPPKSLKEIGNIFNLSSERIRQLKERAFKRVKKRNKSFFDKYISQKNVID